MGRLEATADPELITRSEAMQVLGMSRSGLRHLEGGELTPMSRGGRGVWYLRTEVEAVWTSRMGDESKIAFSLFETGGTPVELVTEHGVDHMLARRLYGAWKSLRELAGCTLILDLPVNVTSRPWLRSYGFGDDGIHPLWALRAIELVAMTPELRARVDRVTQPKHGET